jgi:hypothetical protein
VLRFCGVEDGMLPELIPTLLESTDNRSHLPAIISVLSNLPANTNRFLRGLEASLELENEPGLVSKVVLVVVARGDVVNETRQKIIGFYGPDSQVPGDLDIDASTKHQIKGPIAG